MSILLSKENALQGAILHFNLTVDASDIIQGLLDEATLAPSPDWPLVKIGPFLGSLGSKPKDLRIAILSLFLKDPHCETFGSPGRVLREYLRGQFDSWKVIEQCISFDFGGSSRLNYKECFQAFIKNVAPNRFVFIYLVAVHISQPSAAFLLSPLPQIAFAMESAFSAILLEFQSMVV
jgi:hypothetical protein